MKKETLRRVRNLLKLLSKDAEISLNGNYEIWDAEPEFRTLGDWETFDLYWVITRYGKVKML